MKNAKRLPIIAAVAFVLMLCVSIGIGTMPAQAHELTGVWTVPDANGWNQHLQTGGNQQAVESKSHVVGADGFTQDKVGATRSQSFCEVIDLTKPFRFEWSQANTCHRMIFGLGSSYSDCFYTTKQVGVWNDKSQIVNQAGNVTNLSEHTSDCTEFEFPFAFRTATGGMDGGTVFKSAGTPPDAWAATGFASIPSNPDYSVDQTVCMEIYIGSGEEGDESWIKLAISDYTGAPFANPTLSVTRADFVRKNAVGLDGTLFDNDGTKGFFAHVQSLDDVVIKKRISQGKTIVSDIETGFTVDLPDYAYEYSTVEFEVSSDSNKRAQVSVVKLDNTEETLTADSDGKYSFYMPRGGIKNVKVAEAAFEVTYKDGQQTLAVQNVSEGAAASAPSVPTKKGFVFEGWYTTSDFETKYDFSLAVTEDITLYANWTQAVTVTFLDGDDDNELDWVSVLSGGTAAAPAAPEKQGASFAGWFYDKEGKQPFDANRTYSEDTSVFALWGETVTWHVRGFNAVTTVAVKNAAITPIDMSKACAGNAIDTATIKWYCDENYQNEYDFTTPVSGNMNLYGRIFDAEQVEYAKPVASGWDMNTGMQRDKSGNQIAGEMYGAVGGITVEPSGYSVFVLGNAGMILNTFALDVTKPIYLDYSFCLVDNVAEWIVFTLTDTLSGSYLSGGSDSATNNRGTLTTFIHHAAAQSGTTAPGIQANKNCSLVSGITDLSTVGYKVAPVSSEAYVHFANCMNTMKIVIGETSADSYIELNGVKILNLNCKQSDFADGTAYFTFGSFRTTVFCVKLYQNFEASATATDGKFADNVEIDATNANFGDEVTLTVNPMLENVRYRVSKLEIGDTQTIDPKFAEGEDGMLTYKFNMPFADTEVKVTFAEFAYVLNFNDGYSTNLVDTQYIVPGNKAAKPADPIRNGYVFDGWYTDSSLATEFDFDTVPVSDLELYAKWQKRVYTCTLMSNGEVYDTLTVTGLNQKFVEPEEPVREGYAFDGWYTDEAFENLYSFNKSVTDDITLYAKWISVGGDADVSGCGCNGGLGADVVLIGAALIAAVAVMLTVRAKKKKAQ